MNAKREKLLGSLSYVGYELRALLKNFRRREPETATNLNATTSEIESLRDKLIDVLDAPLTIAEAQAGFTAALRLDEIADSAKDEHFAAAIRAQSGILKAAVFSLDLPLS